MRNIILIISLVFIFNACSSKNDLEQKQVITNTTMTKTSQNSIQTEDDFGDEFEDEFTRFFDELIHFSAKKLEDIQNK